MNGSGPDDPASIDPDWAGLAQLRKERASVSGHDIPGHTDPDLVGLFDAQLSGWFLKDELFRGFTVSGSDSVLEVGCGEGAVTLFCAKRAAHVTFTDIEASCVEAVEAKIVAQGSARDHRGLVCDSDPLLVPDESATRIICQEVLEHVADPARVMSELVRAGTPGALYCLTVPGEQGENIQKAFAPAGYFQYPNHIRIFSKDAFVSLVEDAGLEIVSYSGSGFFQVFWMGMHWSIEARKSDADRAGAPLAVRDTIKPPYDQSLHNWATLWHKLISTPEGIAFKHQLDALLPKNQIIVAKKPG